jgi:hypothetical protein
LFDLVLLHFDIHYDKYNRFEYYPLIEADESETKDLFAFLAICPAAICRLS